MKWQNNTDTSGSGSATLFMFKTYLLFALSEYVDVGVFDKVLLNHVSIKLSLGDRSSGDQACPIFMKFGQ